MTFRLPHLLAAVTLHVALLALVAGGLQCTRAAVHPQVISAVLLDPSRQQVAERERREADQQRRTEAEAQRRLKAEVEARKKKEAEALRQRQAAEKKAAEQKAAEKKKAEDAARRKREQDAAEAARVEQALREEAAAREALARAASEREAKLADWAIDLARHVKQYYTAPPGTPENASCKVKLQLLPNGTVKNVKTVTSCGSAEIDRALENAVYRSSPVPLPADASVFDPDLTINFTP